MVNCCKPSKYNARMLRTLITIKRATRTADGVGGFTKVWADDPVGGVYAYMVGFGGSERWIANRVTPGNRFRAVIRFRDDGSGAPYYSASDIVEANGRTYAIESVVDEDQRREWITLDLLEGGAV